MMKYTVNLSKDERKMLEQLVSMGSGPARQRRRAQILLLTDEGGNGSGMTDKQVASLLTVSTRTIERVREQLVKSGLESVLQRKAYDSSRRLRKVDGDLEAQLVALCCSEAPDSRSRWTIRLLADKLVELEIVDEISRETVRKVLKKTNFSLG